MKNFFSGDTAFARIMNILAGVIWTGLLWLLCTIPVITLPAASMAAYHTMVHCVRGEQSYISGTFFRSFGTYFKKWFGVSILEFFLLVWLLFDCIYLYGYGTEFSQVLSYIIYGFLLLYFAVNGILYPCASRFGGGRFTIFKLAFYITFRHFWASAALVFLMGLSVYALYLMPWSILLVPGLYWFFTGFILEPVLRKYISDKEEAAGKQRTRNKGTGSEEDDEVIETRMGRLIVRKHTKSRSSTDESTEEKVLPKDRIIKK